MLAIVLSPGEVEVVRRPGLKALARLASDNHQALLEIGTTGRVLWPCRDVLASLLRQGCYGGGATIVRWDSGSWNG